YEIMQEEKGFVTKSIHENYGKEVRFFEEAAAQLNKHYPVNSINDVNKLVATINEKKRLLTDKLVKINNVKSNIKDLNVLKEFYFKNRNINIDLCSVIEFTSNQVINEENDKLLLQIADNEFMYVDRAAVFTTRNRTGIYLMEDLEYVILDERLEEKERMNADDLKQHIDDIDSYNKVKEEKGKVL
ncbi:MAG: hypothetical protein ACK5LC_14900, partial [Coprobacillaceae bacterium]